MVICFVSTVTLNQPALDMRIAALAALLFVLSTAGAFAQDTDPNDVGSVDSIITALYDVISGPEGTPRDWDRFHTLFLPEARLVPIVRDSVGANTHRMWSAQDFEDETSQYFDQFAFFEVETFRIQERYGNMVHAFSSYDSYRSLDDDEPFARGINSIQLLFEDDRWWIVTVFWQPEWPDLPMPAEYLPSEE